MSNHLLGWLLVIVAALWIGNCVRYIGMIGKERKPVEASHAGWDMLLNGAIIAVVVVAALRLIAWRISG